ncbi:MAG: uroporphyrinogen-III C-methyltransferase [Candidatus Tectimicrobiota bacterium]
MNTGTVYLVGAGPGAPDLLTVRATKVLARADIVFHDALINKDILTYCTPGCTYVSVGTRCGLSTPRRQDNIHRLLAEAVQQYTTVVRLKGGDPCVFGRTGEDVEFLTAQRIPWEVVPGISAGVGGLSLLGLPVTHRGLSSAVTLVTASREAAGAFEGLAPEVIRNTSHTLVFYMPFRHVDDIARHLIQHGKSPETYALCASWLSYPQQKLVTAPLARIGAAVADAQLETPALLVVGDVVQFWHHLQAGAVEAEEV